MDHAALAKGQWLLSREAHRAGDKSEATVRWMQCGMHVAVGRTAAVGGKQFVFALDIPHPADPVADGLGL